MDNSSGAASAAASLFGGLMLLWMVIGLAFFVFFIWLYWRILDKAGLQGPLALLNLIPGLGNLVVLLILAFSEWPVQRGVIAPPAERGS
ncbi:MAG: hypothetical protein ACYDA5_05265 [Vulcanimicrobiaceae bacterium]